MTRHGVVPASDIEAGIPNSLRASGPRWQPPATVRIPVPAGIRVTKAPVRVPVSRQAPARPDFRAVADGWAPEPDPVIDLVDEPVPAAEPYELPPAAEVAIEQPTVEVDRPPAPRRRPAVIIEQPAVEPEPASAPRRRPAVWIVPAAVVEAPAGEPAASAVEQLLAAADESTSPQVHIAARALRVAIANLDDWTARLRRRLDADGHPVDTAPQPEPATPTAAPVDGPRPWQIREWAATNAIACPGRGKVPKAVADAYHAARAGAR